MPQRRRGEQGGPTDTTDLPNRDSAPQPSSGASTGRPGRGLPARSPLWLKELDARGFRWQARPGSPGTW
eukprot:1446176-Alexandrium_andersonii.AAC.1